MICRRHMRLYAEELSDIVKGILFKNRIAGCVDSFEAKFANYLDRKYAIAVSSGRHGLELLLEALGIKDGDEVIFPAYTLKDLIVLVSAKGIKPVLVDVDENTFNIDVNLVERSINAKTKAIIPTHLFGSPCNIMKIIEICRKHNLIVIEDCAHSLGSEINGIKAGSFGDAAFFSFELTKPINTFGGGMIVTDNYEVCSYVKNSIFQLPVRWGRLYRKMFFAYFELVLTRTFVFNILGFLFYSRLITKIINILYRFSQRMDRIGYSRYTNIQAFIGQRQLDFLDAVNAQRMDKARMLLNLLDPRISSQAPETGALANFYFFIVRFKDCDNTEEIRKKFILHGIDVGIRSEIADDCSKIVVGAQAPVAEKIYSEVIQLPMHEGLKKGNIIYISEICNIMKR